MYCVLAKYLTETKKNIEKMYRYAKFKSKIFFKVYFIIWPIFIKTGCLYLKKIDFYMYWVLAKY